MQRGRPALCEPGAAANGAGTLLSGARRLSQSDGSPIHHHLGCSAFAEHAVVSRRSLVKLDAALPFDEAALFGCAVLTGVGAVVNTAQVCAGQSVAVIGLGGFGLAAVLGSVAAGAREVVAIDLSAAKREAALAMGATLAFDGADPRSPTRSKPRHKAQGGLDHVFEFAGSIGAFETAYRITRRGGTTVRRGDTDDGIAAERPCTARGCWHEAEHPSTTHSPCAACSIDKSHASMSVTPAAGLARCFARSSWRPARGPVPGSAAPRSTRRQCPCSSHPAAHRSTCNAGSSGRDVGVRLRNAPTMFLPSSHMSPRIPRPGVCCGW